MSFPVTICFAYDRLIGLTDGFSEENLIGKFQFGNVYRGNYRGLEVTVKMWNDDQCLYKVRPGDNESRLKDELDLLKYFEDNESHPNLVKLIGYCKETGHLGAVYHLKSLNTLHNLLLKDSLTWSQRIKAALGFASVLEFMHSRNPPYLPYLIRNIDASHIMLDGEYNPILYDFSMISGGILTDRRNLLNQYVDGCHGYVDPACARQGEWSDKCDVFSYGVLLLGLIAKKVYTEEDYFSDRPPVHEWAKTAYQKKKSIMGTSKSRLSLVDHSLESDPLFNSSDGIKITNMALQCVKYDPQKRPAMKQAVRDLLNLTIVQHHAATLGINQMLHGNAANSEIEKLSGFSKLMSKRLDFQLMCNYWKGQFRQAPNCKKVSPQKCGQLLKCCCQYFAKYMHRQLYKDHRSLNFSQAGQEYHAIKVFTYQDISRFANGFSQENFIDNLQFGRVFHGRYEGRKVTVKIWEFPKIYNVYPGQNGSRLREEIVLLQHPKLFFHPNLVKLIGYCHEGEQLGVVYDLEPLDTLYNLVLKDNFSWLQRIKVAIGFACLLKFLHAYNPPQLPYLVRNINAAHIMLDQDCNPRLIDFGMFTGGVLPDRRHDKIQCVIGCYGYIDVDCRKRGQGEWSEKSDVFGYGVLLLSLISKRLYTEEDRSNSLPTLDDWAYDEYAAKMSMAGSSQSKCSLVHPSLEEERGFYPRDAFLVSMLALECVGASFARPTMTQVVKRLLNLCAVRKYADELGIKQMLS